MILDRVLQSLRWQRRLPLLPRIVSPLPSKFSPRVTIDNQAASNPRLRRRARVQSQTER